MFEFFDSLSSFLEMAKNQACIKAKSYIQSNLRMWYHVKLVTCNRDKGSQDTVDAGQDFDLAFGHEVRKDDGNDASCKGRGHRRARGLGGQTPLVASHTESANYKEKSKGH